MHPANPAYKSTAPGHKSLSCIHHPPFETCILLTPPINLRRSPLNLPLGKQLSTPSISLPLMELLRESYTSVRDDDLLAAAGAHPAFEHAILPSIHQKLPSLATKTCAHPSATPPPCRRPVVSACMASPATSLSWNSCACVSEN